MKLPQDLQHFPAATLIIASDTESASFLLAGGEDIEALDAVAVPHERKQDSEGRYVSSDGVRTGNPEQEDDAPRLHEFVHAVTDRLVRLVQDHGIAHVHLVMPAGIEHAVTSHLPKEISAKIGRRIHVEAMKESPLEIVKRVLAG